MHYLDLTLPTPAENLALDEALLEEAERAAEPQETLRLWESDRPLVIVGRSSRIAAEVHGSACRSLGIPVLRRISGGAAVVAGRGCLMYALVLSHRQRPQLQSLDQTHRLVLGRLAAALALHASGLEVQGISDLAMQGRKVSGNSVRVRRHHTLYHGTLLYDFALELIDRCLRMPPRQPAYRGARPHEAFVANLPVERTDLRSVLLSAWQAVEPRRGWPQADTARLAAEKYSRPEWNEQW
ncbi:MAG: lipoate--protein ligase family protein [Thermoguttaceae bacterium]|jgi:lipoate-protein ligase A